VTQRKTEAETRDGRDSARVTRRGGRNSTHVLGEKDSDRGVSAESSQIAEGKKAYSNHRRLHTRMWPWEASTQRARKLSERIGGEGPFMEISKENKSILPTHV
jgi:hypothetical protein